MGPLPHLKLGRGACAPLSVQGKQSDSDGHILSHRTCGLTEMRQDIEQGVRVMRESEDRGTARGSRAGVLAWSAQPQKAVV